MDNTVLAPPMASKNMLCIYNENVLFSYNLLQLSHFLVNLKLSLMKLISKFPRYNCPRIISWKLVIRHSFNFYKDEWVK